MSKAKRAAPPQVMGHLRAQRCENITSETDQTTSRVAFWIPKLRRDPKVKGPGHLAPGSTEPK
eukprot:1605145-Pyramimonas_sp.AAC.1